jgi:hypothetical protein
MLDLKRQKAPGLIPTMDSLSRDKYQKAAIISLMRGKNRPQIFVEDVKFFLRKSLTLLWLKPKGGDSLHHFVLQFFTDCHAV